MFNRNEDRHRTPRSFPSGAQKRKIAAEKEKNFEHSLSKTPKISNYFISYQNSEAIKTEQPVSPSSLAISEFAECESKISAIDIACVNSEAVCNEKPNISSSDILEFGEVESKTDTAVHLEETLENPNFLTDIGLWVQPYSDDMIDFWIKKGPTELQNSDEKILSKFSSTQIRQNVSESTRKCTPSLFHRINQNKEVVNRFWLCFSPSTGKIYCFLCKLLATSPNVALSQEGYCDWKHASERVCQHEISKNHLNSVTAFSSRYNETTCIDSKIKEQVSFNLKKLSVQAFYLLTIICLFSLQI